VLLIFAAAGIIAGAIAWGLHPLANISGQRISAAPAIGLTFAAIAVDLVPTMALASFGLFLSVITRQRVAGVVRHHLLRARATGPRGTTRDQSRPTYLLITQLNAWHGPLQTPTNWGTIGHAIWISAAYATVPLAAAWTIFRDRDVTS
jgi:hypothetical protein